MQYNGAYPDVAAWVRSRLPDADAAGLLADPPPVSDLPPLPDDPGTWTGLDREIGSVLLHLAARFPCTGPYSALGALDKAALSEGAGLLTAARLLGVVTTGGANGDLLLEKTDTTTRQFSQNNTPGNPGSRIRWEREAELAFLRISCIAAVYGQYGRSGVTTATRGRRVSLAEFG